MIGFTISSLRKKQTLNSPEALTSLATHVQMLALWQPCFEAANKKKNDFFLLDKISSSASPTHEIWERDYSIP